MAIGTNDDAVTAPTWGAAFASGRTLPAISALSALSAIGLAIYLSRRSYQVDIDVYLMGGKHALLGDLYSVQFGKPFLRFTYPPFAALAFLPVARALPLMSAQTIWAIVNVGALFALVATSVRLLRPDLDRPLVVKLALAALLPALLLNPVFLTVGLGQVNLILCLGVLWDLVGPRRIGRFTLPQGVVTGIAGAIKLTPLIFIPYLTLTGRRRAAITGSITFVLCSALGFAVAPQTSWAFWTRFIFQSGRAGALFQVSDQNLLSSQSRFDHARDSAVVSLATPRPHRHRWPRCGCGGPSVVLSVPRRSRVCDNRSAHLTDHLDASSGVGPSRDLLAGVGA